MKSKARAWAARPNDFAIGVGRALRRAAKDARKIASMYGTPVYVWKNGKIVTERPRNREGAVADAGHWLLIGPDGRRLCRSQIGCA